MWRPIEEAPKRDQWLEELGNTYVIAKFYQPKNEDGEPIGPMKLVWAQVAHLTLVGWVMSTHGIASVYSYGRFNLLDNATHFMKLENPEAPDE